MSVGREETKSTPVTEVWLNPHLVLPEKGEYVLIQTSMSESLNDKDKFVLAEFDGHVFCSEEKEYHYWHKAVDEVAAWRRIVGVKNYDKRKKMFS